MADDVQRFRKSLDVQVLQTVDAIQTIILASHSDLTENMKWNAPSFALGGDDQITLGLERSGRIRVAMHRGTKPQDLDGFSFDDLVCLARWPAPDRGVIVFQDKADRAERNHARGTTELFFIEAL